MCLKAGWAMIKLDIELGVSTLVIHNKTPAKW